MGEKKIKIKVNSIQWKGNNAMEIIDFLGGAYINENFWNNKLTLHSLSGTYQMQLNDWIINNGMFKPCSKEHFAENFEQLK